MDLLARILTALLYPLALLARLCNRLAGRDPLRLKPGAEPASFWVERDPETPPTSYFAESSVAEGRGKGGAGWIATRTGLLLARLLAPPRSAGGGEKFKPAADREEGIPDEVYTLW